MTTTNNLTDYDDDLSEDELLSLEDAFLDVTADFVSFNDDLMRAVFDQESGKWWAVANLCQSYPDLHRQITELETQSEGTLIANWIDYPGSDNGEGYATVTFFVEAIHWHMIAVYNKKRLTDIDAR